MYKKYLLIMFLVIVTLGCRNNDVKNDSNDNQTAEEVPVTVITAELSTFNEYGEYYGKVEGVHRASIINLISGTVEQINVKEGARVKKGDSLGSISSDKARLTLETAILNEKITRENYQTLKDFLKSGSSSQINVDSAHLQWLTSKTQLLDAQKAYDSALCISPINGIVVTRNIDVDDEVYQGEESFLIEDLSKLVIEIGIPEADMDGIKEGTTAEVTLDLFPDRIWNGILTRYSRKSSENNLTFKAVIEIENRDGIILSGTTAKVKLLRKSHTDIVVIPTDVVINENGNSYVMIAKNNTASKKAVTLGPSNIEKIVITSGINPGDTIINEGKHLLTDSQTIEIKESEV